MADVSLRGVTGCFGGQVACTPERPVVFDAAGGSHPRRRSAPECPAWLTCRWRGVAKRFGEQVAVEAIDLDVAHGELVVLLGPTGAGKTTTLRLIAGLETPDEGEIRIGGRDVTGEPPAARDLAFVFQQYSLYPHMTAYDNMAFPLRAPARPRRRGGDPREGRGGRPPAAHRPQARQQGDPALGRRDAARRHRARARARPPPPT